MPSRCNRQHTRADGQTVGVIELRAANVGCTIRPDDGGRLASLRVGRQQLLVEQGDVAAATGESDPMSWGSYPMAPWAGRVRHGRFVFEGSRHELPINLAPHSIHGTVFTRAWHVDVVNDDSTSATLSCALGPLWPFGGFATQTITLGPDRLDCVLSVTGAEHAMPVLLGWHPWFVKPMGADLRFAAMYQRDAEGIPTGVLVTPPTGPWDDCFIEPLAPITLHYDTCTITVTSDCSHWVVYDQPHHATCIEPQSGPPDAFNLGAEVLLPGQTLQRTMTIRW
ncbi:unannotated protein [freshwater metagenome]|uniref:Unannotated protein n=1 Tax=freshwater metagenome TaxID=449393 RepID=A0A6J7CS31_9ZZZZ|nr:aldose epimerase [Actinomycetota bacterium]